MTFDEAVGLAIYTNRKIRGVSQPELADALDVSPSALSRLENGITQATVVHLRKIAKKLGVSSALITEDAERFFARAQHGKKVDT